MNKRLILAMLNALLFLTPAWSDGSTIDLKRGEHILNGGRSIICTPQASIDNRILSIVFEGTTQAYVQIASDTTSQSTFISENCFTTESLVFDMSSWSSGCYTLSIYAFGCWWTGTFYIE